MAQNLGKNWSRKGSREFGERNWGEGWDEGGREEE